MNTYNDYIISIKDLTVTYQENLILSNLNFHVPKKTIIGIVGPNGSGKTTLLKTILGIVQPQKGIVKIFGEIYNPKKHNIAYIPQKNSVDWNFPINVFDVVMMGRYNKHSWFLSPSKLDCNIVLESLQAVGMEEFANRHINKLSGGQQQRVFLARALAQKADIFILDEPFVGIDTITESLILKLLQNLKDSGKTILVVHHDLNIVKQYFDWTFLMNVEHIALGPTLEVLTHKNIAQTFKL